VSNGLYRCEDCGGVCEQSKRHECPRAQPARGGHVSSARARGEAPICWHLGADLRFCGLREDQHNAYSEHRFVSAQEWQASMRGEGF
jgi:hypothetical protein